MKKLTKTMAAVIAATLMLSSCVTGYTPDQKAEARKAVLQIVLTAWKAGGRAYAAAELEKYIQEHKLDEAQAQFLRDTAAGIADLMEKQAQEAGK